jgi:hypothetical protein
MTVARLVDVLRQSFPELEGTAEQGFWRASVDGFEVYVMADVDGDRLRIMVPVAEADRTDSDLLWVLLVANYDLSVDARYAVQDDVVWCTFLHRLSWMSDVEVTSALTSVLTLAKNTGTTFSSREVIDGVTRS